jgi:hypothetical protein
MISASGSYTTRGVWWLKLLPVFDRAPRTAQDSRQSYTCSSFGSSKLHIHASINARGTSSARVVATNSTQFHHASWPSPAPDTPVGMRNTGLIGHDHACLQYFLPLAPGHSYAVSPSCDHYITSSDGHRHDAGEVHPIVHRQIDSKTEMAEDLLASVIASLVRP